MATSCRPPLLTIDGTGSNRVEVPQTLDGKKGQYNDSADKLLYEIWQTLLLILAANPPAMTIPIIFTVGDGQADTPANGSSSLVLANFGGILMGDKEFIVIRNGILMQYSNIITPLQIIRKNTGATGGFIMDPAPGGDPLAALTFQNGDSYQIFPIGINTTIE